MAGDRQVCHSHGGNDGGQDSTATGTEQDVGSGKPNSSIEVTLAPHADSKSPCDATAGDDSLVLQVMAMDPEMETPKVEVRVSSASCGTASLCCPMCRRPLSLDFSFGQQLAQGCAEARCCLPIDLAGNLQIRIRNAHDAHARWLPASHANVVVPSHGSPICAQCRCPQCHRDICMQLERVTHDVESNAKQTVAGIVKPTGDCAYATLLYGSAVDYFIGALVLGWTLAAPVLEPGKGPSYRRVLLHTNDVPTEYLQVLSRFWELRSVDYLTGSAAMYHDYNGSRFKQVFTKLQALSQLDFDKVLMLDNDLIVRRNIDELFDLPAPAALKRPGGRDQPEHGQRFRPTQLWNWRRLEKDEPDRGLTVHGWKYDMLSGINAGVMLLHPDRAVYQRMLAEIQDHEHPEHLDCYGPEQEYIGRFYSTFGPGWTHMDSRFNYQPLLGRGANRFMRSLDVQREVAIAHFSGPRIKPWAGLVGRQEALAPASVKRLLNEDPRAFGARFPENPRLLATGAEAYGEKGFPTLVVSLIREWADEFRRAVHHLREREGVDVIAVVETVHRGRWGLFERLRFVLSTGRHLMIHRPLLFPILALIFGLLRRVVARRALLRPSGHGRLPVRALSYQ